MGEKTVLTGTKKVALPRSKVEKSQSGKRGKSRPKGRISQAISFARISRCKKGVQHVRNQEREGSRIFASVREGLERREGGMQAWVPHGGSRVANSVSPIKLAKGKGKSQDRQKEGLAGNVLALPAPFQWGGRKLRSNSPAYCSTTP